MRWTVVFSVFALSGCSDEEESVVPVEEPDSAAPSDGCEGDVLEEDFAIDASLGAAGDPSTWPALPPDARVATTFLRLQPTEEGQAAFGEALGPVIGELMAGPAGLMGLSLGGSATCGTARTLSVWESEAAMMEFVLGEAHGAAIARTAEISRGGSITSSWAAGDLPEISWAAVSAALAGHEGPSY